MPGRVPVPGARHHARAVSGQAWQPLPATSLTRIVNPPGLSYIASYDVMSNTPLDTTTNLDRLMSVCLKLRRGLVKLTM